MRWEGAVLLDSLVGAGGSESLSWRVDLRVLGVVFVVLELFVCGGMESAGIVSSGAASVSVGMSVSVGTVSAGMVSVCREGLMMFPCASSMP